METIKKLSHSSFVAVMNAARIAKTEAKRIQCGRFLGIATGTKPYTSQYGSGEGLIGSFAGVSPETGEVVKATSLFLPDLIMLPLLAAVKSGQSPKFCVDVFAVLDEKAPVGFSYRFEEVIEAEQDPIAGMLAAANQIKAISGPAKTEENPAGETPAPATKTGKGRK